MELPADSQAPLRRLLRVLTHPAATGCYLAIMLLPLLLAGQYNHPSSDDYSNSVWMDFWAFQRYAYLKLTGRVASSFVVSLNPIRWGSFAGYKLAAGALIICFALTYTLTVCRLLGFMTRMPYRLRLLLGAASTVIIFNGTVSLAEGFYWFTGSMTYTLPVILLCWAVLAGIRMHAGGRLRTRFTALQGCCVALATTGNEVIIPVIGLMTIGLSAFYYRQGQRLLMRWYLALTAIWAMAAAVEILAPGNFLRQSVQHRDMLIAMPTWLYYSKNLFLEWITEPVFLAFSIGCAAILTCYRATPGLKALPALLLSLGVIAVIMFPGFWALGGAPPRRVRNLCYMTFLPCWLLTLTALAAWARDVAGRLPEAWRLLRTPLLIGTSLLLLSQFRIETLRASSNYVLLAKNFRKGTLKKYDAEQQARYALMRSSRSDTVLVPKLRATQSNIVYFGDIGPDPALYPNPSFAQYWRKQAAALLPDTAVLDTQ